MANVAYDFTDIQNKWSAKWLSLNLNHAEDFSPKPKKYVLVEFPYPSGAGLHMGHCRNYSMMDAYSRFYRMQGFNVLYPMGWDAFGLPTYNHAIKMNRDPHEVSVENINTFRRQLQDLGLSFDWEREVDTTNPKYYKWTQWIFVKLFDHYYDKEFIRKDGGKGQARPISDLAIPQEVKEKGDAAIREYQDQYRLAYKAKMPVDWCPFCKMGVAKEEVLNDGTHERCGTVVGKKDLEQWILRITAYADRLIDDLEMVDYPTSVKNAQKNWIGRSEGINIDFKVKNSDEVITCFTTTPVNFGATFIVLAPEHQSVLKVTTQDNIASVTAYINQTKSKSDIERLGNKEKTGVFTGAYVHNHLTGKPIPVWVSDFVLPHFGTGAVQGCPGHDMRDFEFAQKYNIPIVRVVVNKDGDTSEITKREQVIEKHSEGTMVNSEFVNGLPFDEAMEKTKDYFEEKGWGTRTTSFKLRDWIFSRQHYWGEPTPMVHCEKCGWQAINIFDLPVELPKLPDYKMGEDGSSPLSKAEEWKKTTCPTCGGAATRETDVMPNWAGSNWYYLRYLDPINSEKPVDFNTAKYWMSVDIYDGGSEHVTLHLLYSRFIYKFLYDLGTAPTQEPYAKRRIHGVVMGPDGKKMSKSLGNIINPDPILKEYGSDVARAYVMFMGPYEGNVAWSDESLNGIRRFFNKVYEKFSVNVKTPATTDSDLVLNNLRKTSEKIANDIPELKFNTSIAALMEFYNKTEKEQFSIGQIKDFMKILAPFAPFLAEEIWSLTLETGSIHQENWPTYDKSQTIEEVEISVQVNGKFKGIIPVTEKTLEEEAISLVLKNEKVASLITGYKKVIYIPGKTISFIIG